jgi:L-threonylcarbamoyladenylate synthase
MNTESKTLKITPDDPSSEAIRKAAATIKDGGIVAYPTRCLYGLGADALDTKAVQRLYAIKKRSAQKPILVLIDGTRQLDNLVTRVTGIASQIMRLFWPGKITLVFEATASVPIDLTGGSQKIGVRQPGHPAAAALVKSVGRPITGTSANISGHPGCHRVEDLAPELTSRLDLILDAGPLIGGRGSTVVDVTGETPRILREGVIPASDIMALTAG